MGEYFMTDMLFQMHLVDFGCVFQLMFQKISLRRNRQDEFTPFVQAPGSFYCHLRVGQDRREYILHK